MASPQCMQSLTLWCTGLAKNGKIPGTQVPGTQLGRALAGIIFLYTVRVKIQLLERIVHTPRCWVMFENSQNCGQIIGTSHGSIFHAAKSPQMSYTATILKFVDFNTIVY